MVRRPSANGRFRPRMARIEAILRSLRRIADAAADGPGLLDSGALALQQGVDRFAEVVLGDLGLILTVVHRAGVADLPLLVEDEELRRVGGAIGPAGGLALVIGIDVIRLVLLHVVLDARELVDGLLR